MRIERRYTTDGQSAYAGIDFRLTTSEIRNPDGSVVFLNESVSSKTVAALMTYMGAEVVPPYEGDEDEPNAGG